MRSNKKTWIIGIVVVLLIAAVILTVVFVRKGKENGEQTDRKEKNELLTEDGELFDYQKTGTIQVGNYKGVKVLVEPDEEDVNLELASVAEDIKILPENKTVKKGDYVYIDYTGTLNGVELEELQGEDVFFKVGDYEYVKAFEDALIGREVGKKYSIPVSFAQDYGIASVAGKRVDFQVTIKAKLDDFYVKKITKSKCSDVDSYKKKLAKRLRKENMENAAELAWEALMEECEVNEHPKKLVKEEIDNLNMQYTSFAEVSGISYDELMDSLMMDEESVAETAQDTVRDRMVAKTIAKYENFTLDNDTCRKYLIQLMEYEEDDKESLANLMEDYKEDYGSRPKDDILVAMAKDFVLEHAVIQ